MTLGGRHMECPSCGMQNKMTWMCFVFFCLRSAKNTWIFFLKSVWFFCFCFCLHMKWFVFFMNEMDTFLPFVHPQGRPLYLQSSRNVSVNIVNSNNQLLTQLVTGTTRPEKYKNTFKLRIARRSFFKGWRHAGQHHNENSFSSLIFVFAKVCLFGRRQNISKATFMSDFTLVLNIHFKSI